MMQIKNNKSDSLTLGFDLSSLFVVINPLCKSLIVSMQTLQQLPESYAKK